MYKLGPKSLAKLKGVRPELVKVVKKAITITTQDFSVLCGVRTREEQLELYSQGRTKPGKIVTWTKNSRHENGSAVDLIPYPVDWNTQSKFDAIASAMLQAAEELGIPLRWGADWDMDGIQRERGEVDSPHFELIEAAK